MKKLASPKLFICMWTDLRTNIEITVKRTIGELDFPPDKDEIYNLMSIEQFSEAIWESYLY
jgi:hypothetical protein